MLHSVISLITLDFVIVKLKRKQSMMIGCAIVVAISVIPRIFGAGQSNLQQIFGMALGRCLISTTSVNIAYVYGLSSVYINELFPDNIKSSATGLIEALHNSGSIFSPYVVTWSVDAHMSPIVVFAIILLFGSSGVYFILDKKTTELDSDGSYSEMKEMKQ